MFKIGQKVVCIDDSIGLQTRKKHLTLNKDYTIRDVEDFGFGQLVSLSEVLLPICFIGREMMFGAERFRPLDETFSEETIAMLNEHFSKQTVEI